MITDKDLENVGARRIGTAFTAEIPRTVWSLNNCKIEKLDCCCCNGVVVWNWESAEGRSDKLKDLLMAVGL